MKSWLGCVLCAVVAAGAALAVPDALAAVPMAQAPTTGGVDGYWRPYTGPVAVLTGNLDISAGEGFVQALMGKDSTRAAARTVLGGWEISNMEAQASTV
ncbi:MAG: hypothetical protein ACRDQZ_12355 [Mycobacteriales bacterium]